MIGGPESTQTDNDESTNGFRIFKGFDDKVAKDDDTWGVVVTMGRLKKRLNQRKEIQSVSSLSGDQSSLDQQQNRAASSFNCGETLQFHSALFI